MWPARFVGALQILLMVGPPIAKAEATYEYVGNPFQEVVGLYTTSDSLSGTIEIPSALAPNRTNAEIALDAWSFSDGLKVFTPANSSAGFPVVSTDGAGRIVHWSFDFSGAGGVGSMSTFNTGIINEVDQARDFVGANSRGSNRGIPGTWTLAPEPSSDALGALSVSLLVVARARHRLRHRPSSPRT